MHTILGAGGPVANALCRELAAVRHPVRLVSRRPVASPGPDITWQKADLTIKEEVMAATRGSSVIYLCAGLVYDAKIWQVQWPLIIDHVIAGAQAAGARLIFFDNVYMYGLVHGPMKETTPYNPCSAKGRVREEVANRIMGEVKAGKLRASVGRAADFYATESGNSFIDMMVLDKYAKKKKAQWIGNPSCRHNFSFIPDMGKAMFLLGQRPDSDNQVWHLPTAPAISGKEFLDLAAAVYRVKPSYTRVNKLMMRLIGLFTPVVKESVEMYYQFDNDYVFDSSKFEMAFNMKPTPYAEGLHWATEHVYVPK